jgi:WD40 repeat protein
MTRQWRISIIGSITAILLACSTPSSRAQGRREAAQRETTLPATPVARLGTNRWRYPSSVELVHFRQNGKELLVCCGDGLFRVVDVASGKELQRFGTKEGSREAVSPDGSRAAEATFDGKVHVWNVATGKEIAFFPVGEDLRGVCFVKAAQLIAWTHRSISVWDIATGRLARVLLDEAQDPLRLWLAANPTYAVASPDARTLIVCLEPWKPPKDPWNPVTAIALTVWNLKTGTHQGTLPIEVLSSGRDYVRPVFTPDSRYFALPELDGKVSVYDLASLDKVHTLDSPRQQGAADDLCFSADGKTLAVLTPRQTIQLFDLSSGKPLREIGEALPLSVPLKLHAWCSAGVRLAWSSRSALIAQSWGPGMIRLWEAKTGKGTDAAMAHYGPLSGLRVSADGKSAVTLGQDKTVRTWTIATGKEQRRVALPPMTTRADLLGPGRALLHSRDGSLSVWDIEPRKTLITIRRNRPKEPRAIRSYVSSDGRSLLVVEDSLADAGQCYTTLYNLETGAKSEGLAKNWSANDTARHAQLTSFIRASREPCVVATFALRKGHRDFGGLGGFVSFHHGFVICCKQSETARTLLWQTEETPLDEPLQAICFSPDQRTILTLNEGRGPSGSLLESLTGKVRYRFGITKVIGFEGELGGPFARVFRTYEPPVHAFSRNGGLLAVRSDLETTTVIDIRRGKVIARLQGDDGEVCCLAFGADPATLLTGGSDGTVLVWDLGKHIRKSRQPVELTAAQVERLWGELADPDTPRAYRALGILVTAPEKAVSLLQKKLKPVKPVPAADIDRLVNDLDSERFRKREHASRELRRLGRLPRMALKKRLKTGVTLELRNRIEALLEELQRREARISPEELREVRAVEVLETIGTPAARSLLKSLVGGAEGARLTDEAGFALERLEKRK